MRKLFKAAVRHALVASSAVIATLALPSAGQATVTVVGPVIPGQDPCTNFTFNVVITACAGGYDKNLLKGSVSDPDGLAGLVALGAPGTGVFLEKLGSLSSVTNLIDFNTPLTGWTVFGLHAGGAGGTNSTYFFLFDAGAGQDVIAITGRLGANSTGLSNAALFQTGSAVPEPATWAMMLLGFGAIGTSLRFRRRALPQAA